MWAHTFPTSQEPLKPFLRLPERYNTNCSHAKIIHGGTAHQNPAEHPAGNLDHKEDVLHVRMVPLK